MANSSPRSPGFNQRLPRRDPLIIAISALWLAACSPQAEPPASAPARSPAGSPIDPPTAAAPPPILDAAAVAALDPSVAERLQQSHARWRAAVASGDSAAQLALRLGQEHAELALAFEQYALADAAFGWTCPQSTDPACYYLWGRSLQATARSDEARTLWQRALQLAPDALPVRLHLAELELDLGDSAAAAAVLGARGPDAGAAELGLRGRIALAAGDAASARELLQAALQLDPEAARLRYPLGLALRALGREQEAAAELARRGSQSTRIDDPWWDRVQAQAGSSQTLLTRAGDLALAGSHAEAATLYQQALALEDEPATRVNLAISLARSGSAAEAERHYRAALADDPTQVAGWFGLGALLADAGQDEQAIEAYETALALHPGANDTRFNLANAQHRSGHHSEAAANYRTVIELDPARVDAHLGLAAALTASGQWSAARQTLENALAVHPGEARIALELARLLAAAPEPAARDGEAALRLAAHLFQSERSLGHGEALAMALAEVGRHAEAASLQGELIAAAQTQGRSDLLPRLQAAQRVFLSGRAWRLTAASANP